MAVTSPEKLNERYDALFRVADLENLLALYEPDAVLSAVPGKELRGHAEIRAQLKRLLKLRGEHISTLLTCVRQSDIALLQVRWSFSGKGPGGSTIVMGGVSAKLARRGTDGEWRYAIDLPATPHA
ncbi:MAG: nuclear transport factor 2 family protein [Pseudomonadota bacterium]